MLDTQHLKPILIGSAVAVGTATAITLVPMVVGAAGFGPAGISAGSWAAAWQSSIGSVAAGSIFSIIQSAGAASSLVASTSYTLAAAGTTGAAAATLKLIRYGKK